MKNDRLIDLENDFTEEEEAVFQVTTETENTSQLNLEESVVKKYRGGMTIVQIAKDHDISVGKIYDILARHNVTLRKGRSKRSKSYKRLKAMTREEKAALINDYINGVPLKELFNKYNINKHGVYTLLNQANVPLKQDSKLQEETDNKVVQPEVQPNYRQLTIDDFLDDTEEKEESKDIQLIKLKKQDNTLHIKLSKEALQNLDNFEVSIDLEGEVS